MKRVLYCFISHFLSILTHLFLPTQDPDIFNVQKSCNLSARVDYSITVIVGADYSVITSLRYGFKYYLAGSITCQGSLDSINLVSLFIIFWVQHFIYLVFSFTLLFWVLCSLAFTVFKVRRWLIPCIFIPDSQILRNLKVFLKRQILGTAASP